MFISQTTDFHFANYRFSFRKLQISISQTTDFHFAKYRFPFRKLQIPILQTTDFHFHFVSSHFVSQTTVSPKNTYIASNLIKQAMHFFSNYANSENSSIESGSGSWVFYVKHSLSVNDNYQSSILQMGTCTNHFQNNYCKSCNSVLSLYIQLY